LAFVGHYFRLEKGVPHKVGRWYAPATLSLSSPPFGPHDLPHSLQALTRLLRSSGPYNGCLACAFPRICTGKELRMHHLVRLMGPRSGLRVGELLDYFLALSFVPQLVCKSRLMNEAAAHVEIPSCNSMQWQLRYPTFPFPRARTYRHDLRLSVRRD